MRHQSCHNFSQAYITYRICPNRRAVRECRAKVRLNKITIHKIHVVVYNIWADRSNYIKNLNWNTENELILIDTHSVGVRH